jgi:hypothetical protein
MTMSVLRQLKCAFNGHVSSLVSVNELNQKEFTNREKSLDTLCARCNYPITLKKYQHKPDKYYIIER